MWRTTLIFAVSALGVLASASVKGDGGPRVVGGELAMDGEFPFVVQLHVYSNHIAYRCGGSILTPTVILTAGHCVEDVRTMDRTAGNFVEVVAGSNHWRDRTSNSQIRLVHTVVLHPDYYKNETTLENDVALLCLSDPLTFGPFVEAVTLQDPAQPLLEGTAQICGWGGFINGRLSIELLKADIPLVSSSVCKRMGIYNENVTICAGGMGSDTCGGDSGGPLLCRAGTKKFQCGITSWSWDFECSELNRPAFYARVSHFAKWIHKLKGYSHRRNDTVCGAGRFFCDNTNVCIKPSWICDGDNDCMDGSDELGCGECASDRFKCATTNQCMSAKWVCDQRNDCGDGSDETGCGQCLGNMFRCVTGGACIRRTLVCNGKRDCVDNSDERGCQ